MDDNEIHQLAADLTTERLSERERALLHAVRVLLGRVKALRAINEDLRGKGGGV